MVEPAFLLELGGVVVGLALLARIAARYRLPASPLFLLAGLAFGEGGMFPLLPRRSSSSSGPRSA